MIRIIMKNKAPSFQFYPKDFLSNSNVMFMTMAQRGIYMTLMCLDWLEDGIEQSKIESLTTVQADVEALKACFVPHAKKSGHVTAKMLVEVRQRRADWIRKSSEGGKKSGRSRSYAAKGGSLLVDKCLANGSIKNEPNSNSSSSSSSSFPSTDLNTYTLPPSVPVTMRAALQSWQKLQREKYRREVSQVEVDALLMKWSPEWSDLEKALVHSTANGWKNVRAPDAPAAVGGGNGTYRRGESQQERQARIAREGLIQIQQEMLEEANAKR